MTGDISLGWEAPDFGVAASLGTRGGVRPSGLYTSRERGHI